MHAEASSTALRDQAAVLQLLQIVQVTAKVTDLSLPLMQDAGADASYVEAPRNLHELKEVGKKTKVAFFVGVRFLGLRVNDQN